MVIGIALVLLIAFIAAIIFVGTLRHVTTETIFAFIAFYFLLFGLKLMFSPAAVEGPLLGDFFASVALTFFWTVRRKSL